MKTVTLIGRNSKLSQLQLQLVKQKIEQVYSNISVQIITKTSQGDTLQNIPLQTVEGSDFFTKDIYQSLETGEADIAVHSLKDMSYNHFTSKNVFSVVDRNDVRDVAIFNNNIVDKIKNGEEIVIGTCSPRRERMATQFLQKALPQFGNNINIVTKPIRGNVETRLQKLNTNNYDATILATAGLNRMISSREYGTLISNLLYNKKLMLLPLFECVPAPCQGAIVAEANPTNAWAVEIINSIKNIQHHNNCVAEKTLAHNYGSGCNQPFGVTTINFATNLTCLYAAGNTTTNNEPFEWFSQLPTMQPKKLFASTNYMKDFFTYKWINYTQTITTKVAFIANYKSINTNIQIPENTLITASGTRTWCELAKKGYWVTANADALGFEQMVNALQMPLFNFNTHQYTIVTNTESAERWKQKGFDAIGNYELQGNQNKQMENEISNADMIFWTSFMQFKQYKNSCKPKAIHSCSGGETAQQLQQQGINPIIFPTIKAFQLWKQYNIL